MIFSIRNNPCESIYKVWSDSEIFNLTISRNEGAFWEISPKITIKYRQNTPRHSTWVPIIPQIRSTAPPRPREQFLGIQSVPLAILLYLSSFMRKLWTSLRRLSVLYRVSLYGTENRISQRIMNGMAQVKYHTNPQLKENTLKEKKYYILPYHQHKIPPIWSEVSNWSLSRHTRINGQTRYNIWPEFPTYSRFDPQGHQDTTNNMRASNRHHWLYYCLYIGSYDEVLDITEEPSLL